MGSTGWALTVVGGWVVFVILILLFMAGATRKRPPRR
jgi:hypothetical protein